MAQMTPKRKIKDSVFTNLFQNKKYLLRLYKALHPEDSSVTEDDIRDVTMKHILVDADYNDLGFSIGDRLVVLVESQSTWTLNIIIRALLYLVQTYHDYFKRTRQNLYGSRKVNMPKPELYVIFTGSKTALEKRENPPDLISLSRDFFGGERIAIDAEVRVLYQEDESNIIGEYIIFCRVYNEQRKKYGQTREAVLETIRICKDRNVLREYLENKEGEVIDIMMTLFDEEEIMKTYLEAYAEDIKSDEARQTAKIMLKNRRIQVEEIPVFFPKLTLEDAKELEAEITQMV